MPEPHRNLDEAVALLATVQELRERALAALGAEGARNARQLVGEATALVARAERLLAETRDGSQPGGADGVGGTDILSA